MSNSTSNKQRFEFIDQFRGFIGVLMLLGHSSYYFNSIWLQLDPFDPLFPSWGQFILRYAGYLCAPGFLMMAGAMVWWSYHRRVVKGSADWSARWHFIQRGIFLILVQLTWVNSSWGGFRELKLTHIGIIACIGISIILLTFIVRTKWYVRLIIAMTILLIHPLLLRISYSNDVFWQQALMQTFIDAGDFNKYPVLPWFSLAVLGSVMANGWLGFWKT
ncbi:MAG TPA: heparan-alpha-glucosaminide N-acetyltransferase domain-containing protein, partial [Bacteroidales bacterium]|nr:heparan-alpha-glucosaminide N-acetyltransferase domain-containing protein [Bacteroidales bacterium]